MLHNNKNIDEGIKVLRLFLEYLDKQIEIFGIIERNQNLVNRPEHGLLYYLVILKLIRKNTCYTLELEKKLNTTDEKDVWFGIFPSRFILENTIKLRYFSRQLYFERTKLSLALIISPDIDKENEQGIIDSARYEGIDLQKQKGRIMPDIKKILETEVDDLKNSYKIYEHFSQILHGNPTYARAALDDRQVYTWALLITVKSIGMFTIGNYEYLQKIKGVIDIDAVDFRKETMSLLQNLAKTLKNNETS